MDVLGLLTWLLATIFSHPWTCLAVLLVTYVVLDYVRRPRNLPPGPPALPVVGAVNWILNDISKPLFAARKKYGDVVCVYIGSTPHIFLNSQKAIMEAFVKRGDEFAYRPPSHEALVRDLGFTGELFGPPYSDEWKARKKFAFSALRSHGFGTPKSEDNVQAQLDRLEEFLLATGGAPINAGPKFGPLSAGIMTSILFSADYAWDDPKMTKVVEFANEIIPLFETIFFIQLFAPSLPRWVMKIICWVTARSVVKANDKIINFLNERIREHSPTLDPQHPRDVMDVYLIERQKNGIQDDDVISATLTTVLPDSIDFVSKVMDWILLYVTSHPEVQTRLHDVIDDVCGSSRRPALADRAQLAYVDAVVLEVLRIIDFLPTTLYRAAAKDTTFRGYHIPKGVPIAGNLYGVHFDPEVHPDPFVFNPDRYMSSEGKLVNTGGVMTFSVGPRSCMGSTMVKFELFLFTARVFHRFKLEFPETEASPSLESKPFSFPRPYRVKFLPR